MSLPFILFTVLLLAPALVIAGFWRASRQHHVQHPEAMPDAEALVLARVAGILCGLLPALQMGAGMERWRTGEPGLYLWYMVPVGGLLLAVVTLAAILTHARGTERGVSSGMVLLSISMLLLITLLQSSGTA